MPLLSTGRIGLLGGSFNPAHDGHVHISRLALERLNLDQVWWLVSPQNPLKPAQGMAALKDRLRAARGIAAADAGIAVTDIENDLGTRYTVDTLDALKRRFPEARFVWIMGADNMVQFHRWQRWREIFQAVGVAVFPRAPYSLRALSSIAARRFAGRRIRPSRAGTLADMPPPAWVFLRARRHGGSATRIRAQRALGGAAGDT